MNWFFFLDYMLGLCKFYKDILFYSILLYSIVFYWMSVPWESHRGILWLHLWNESLIFTPKFNYYVQWNHIIPLLCNCTESCTGSRVDTHQSVSFPRQSPPCQTKHPAAAPRRLPSTGRQHRNRGHAQNSKLGPESPQVFWRRPWRQNTGFSIILVLFISD